MPRKRNAVALFDVSNGCRAGSLLALHVPLHVPCNVHFDGKSSWMQCTVLAHSAEMGLTFASAAARVALRIIALRACLFTSMLVVCMSRLLTGQHNPCEKAQLLMPVGVRKVELLRYL